MQPSLSALATLNPVERLIVRLCRRESLDSFGRNDLGILEDPKNSRSFLEVADRHGIQGLVLTKLEGFLPKDAVGAAILKQLLSPLPLLRRQATLWELEQERILSFLNREGFRFLVLKGGALRNVAYRSAGERPMGDVDILTSPADFSRVLEALAKLGYGSKYPEEARVGFKEHLYHERVTHPNGFEVEAHWGLTRPSAHFWLDPEWFLNRSRPLRSPRGLEMLVPSPEDMILHMVSQSEQDGIRKLCRIVDVDRVVAVSEELDWDYIWARAEEGRLTNILAVFVRLANLLLCTPAPRFLLEGQRMDPFAHRNLESLRPVPRLMRAPKRGRVVADNLFRFWCLPTWQLRQQALRQLAAGDRDPLLWVWEEKDHPEVMSPGRFRGFAAVLKLFVYQAAIGIRGVAGWFPGVHRHRFRFWKTAH